jgi:hypothetical protein
VTSQGHDKTLVKAEKALNLGLEDKNWHSSVSLFYVIKSKITLYVTCICSLYYIYIIYIHITVYIQSTYITGDLMDFQG